MVTEQSNSPVDLFHKLVTPAMEQLQIANLALMGWAQQECERLVRAGRHQASTRRMEAVVEEEQRHIGPYINGGYQNIGLGMCVFILIKLRVRAGEQLLTVVELGEVEQWLGARYKDGCVTIVNGYFRIEWNNNHAQVEI